MIKSLRKLAENLTNEFPIESSIILSDIYVDDLLTGANTIAEAQSIRDQVITVLAKGGFELRK